MGDADVVTDADDDVQEHYYGVAPSSDAIEYAPSSDVVETHDRHRNDGVTHGGRHRVAHASLREDSHGHTEVLVYKRKHKRYAYKWV